MRSGTTQRKMCIKFRFQSYLKRFLVINYELTAFQGRVVKNILRLRNGPDKNDSNNGNEQAWNAKKVLTFLLSVLTSDWVNGLHVGLCILCVKMRTFLCGESTVTA